jgi:formylglycine-generating enzyme required for sulfatase activity
VPIQPLSPGKGTPATYAIQTRTGGLGILQVSGSSSDSSEVKIRYKLVQNAVSATAAQTMPVPAPPLTVAQKAMLTGEIAGFVSQLGTKAGIKLVPIPAGTFLLGSPADEARRQPREGPQTRVTLTKGFFLGTTDVTQAQWTVVMGTNPSYFLGDTLPVEFVSWDDAMAFCKKLTEREQAARRLPAGWAFTLPTEAQWEYACRAGTTGPHAGDLDAMAWYSANSGYTTHPVGTKQPNGWGLFDMHGNVWEWCADWYWSYPGGSVTDPVGPESGSARVFRGGSWSHEAEFCRSAFRFGFAPDPYRSLHSNNIGFRVALSAVQ